jgi:hypothetical protein
MLKKGLRNLINRLSMKTKGTILLLFLSGLLLLESYYLPNEYMCIKFPTVAMAVFGFLFTLLSVGFDIWMKFHPISE